MLLVGLVAISCFSQISVSQFIEGLEPSAKMLFVPIGSTQSPDTTFNNVGQLRESLKLRSFERTEHTVELQWDSSDLFPPYIPMDQDKQLRSGLLLLSELLKTNEPAQLFTPPGHQPPQSGVTLNSISANASGLVGQVLPDSSSVTAASDARLRFSANPYLVLRSAAGDYLQFFIRPGANLPSQKLTADAPIRRVPETLRNSLGSVSVHVDPGTRYLSLRDLVDRIKGASSARLYFDRRFAERQIAIRNSGQSEISSVELATAIANALDAYWRPVGSSYMLAISPADPRWLSRTRYLKEMRAQATELIDALSKAGELPAGLDSDLLLAGPTSLSDMSGPTMEALARCLEFRTSDDERAFRAALTNPAFLQGTIQFSMNGTLSVYSASAGHDVGTSVDLQDIHSGN
jgi:hypothetical protein